MKRMVKSVSGSVIRSLSFLLPRRVLFRLFLAVRRLHVWLTRKGAPAILLKAMDHVFYSLRPGLVTGQLDGAPFIIRVNDPCHYNHLLGVHEPPVVAWVREGVKPGMHVVDVGANIGFYTVMLARLVGAQGRVLSVEADPDVARVLEQNVHINQLANVQVVSGAASSASGTLRLGRATASSWFTGVHYRQAAEWIEVPAHPLDALAGERGLRPVHFVKIDVEGAETAVLEGMERILREDRPIVLVELHDYNGVGSEHPALDQLRHAGYGLRYLTDEHVISLPEGLKRTA